MIFDGPADAQKIKIINLDQVRIVDQISDNHIRLLFTEGSAVELSGKSAGQLGRLLISRGVDVNGLPMPDLSDIDILDGSG